MMNTKLKVGLGLLVIGIVLITGYMFQPEKQQELEEKGILVKYQVVGGEVGYNNILTIYKDGKVKYHASASGNVLSNLESKLDQKQIESLIETFNKNKFLSFKDEYIPSTPIMDDMIHAITYTYNFKAKTVTASGVGNPPEQFSIILSELSRIIENLTKSVNSGIIKIERKYILEEWPFSSRVRLSDYLYERVSVDEDVFNQFKKNYQEGKEVLYFENEWIYGIGNSGGFALSYEKLKEFHITIHSKSEPIQWYTDIGIRLADIHEKGIFIQGYAYQRIKGYTESNKYPIYFIEDELKTGNYVYEIRMLRGDRK